jgi:hypothetical protein
VVGQDHVRREARPQAAHVDPARGQRVELVDQGRRVDDHPRSDDRDDVGVEDPGRDEVELEHLVAQHQGVAGVVAALVAHDEGGLLGQEVGRLALAFVTPLEPDDDRGRHQLVLREARGREIKRPRSLPGSRIHHSLDPSPIVWRGGWVKVLIRLTGRTTRLPRATAGLLLAGAPRGRVEDAPSIPAGPPLTGPPGAFPRSPDGAGGTFGRGLRYLRWDRPGACRR